MTSAPPQRQLYALDDKTHVLVVEDEADISEVVRRGLDHPGVIVDSVGDVRSALTAIQRRPYEIVILDMTLPDGSGLSVLEALRDIDTSAHVIILSGAGQEQARVLALEAGADDYVVKPFSVRELAARVVAVRRRKQAAGPGRRSVGPRETDLAVGTLVNVRGTVGWADAGALAILGVSSASDVVGRNVFDLVAPAWRKAAEARRAIGDSGRWPNSQILAMAGADGADRMVQVSSVPITWRGEAASRVTLTRVTDPPARIRQLVTGILSDVSDAVIVTDTGLHIRSWNESAHRLYGWTEEEVLGRHFQDVVGWAGEDETTEGSWEALREAGRWFGEGVQQTRDGAMISVRASTMLARDESGEPIGVVSVNRLVQLAPTEAPSPPYDDARLREAIRQDEFEIYYQPVVTLDTRRIVAVEALVRWRHPELGLLAPGAFIREAERSGAILPLGRLIAEKTCRQAAAWRAAGIHVDVAMNLSTRQLADPDLTEQIAATLISAGLPASALWMEVTETALVEDFEAAADALHRLAGLGVRLSIDDFGTGWASLTYLHRFPVHALKIDRSFVSGVETNPSGLAIARSIVALGAELGLAVVAEGIETEAERAVLADIGCALGQGYLFSKPVPGPEMTLVLTAGLG